MNTRINFRFLIWSVWAVLLFGTQAARAEPFVYIPLGGDGKIVVIDAARV